MYTEEELLEVVDILMEDYNLSEEEAIDIIIEETDAERKARRKENLKKYGRKVGRKAATSAVVGGLVNAAMPLACKKAGIETPKEIKRNAAIGGVAAAAGTAYLAHRAYKKYQAKKALKENSKDKRGIN